MKGKTGRVSIVIAVLATVWLGVSAVARGGRPAPDGGRASVPARLGEAVPQSRFDGRLGVLFSNEFDAQGRAITRIDGNDLTVVKTADAYGQVELVVSFRNDRFAISLGPDGIVVSRGRARATLNPKRMTEADMAGVERVIGGSPAVKAFKRLTAQIEFSTQPDDGFTLGAMVDGALVRILDGEIGVVRRLDDRLRGRFRTSVRPASFRFGAAVFTDCWGEYGSTVNEHMDTFIECVDEAGDAPWYLRSVLAAGCELDWVMRAETAAFQFLGCAAVPLQ